MGLNLPPTHSLKATEFLLKLDGVVKINPGSTAEKFTFDRPMTLERNGLSGSVVLGETLEASPDFESGFRVRD